MAIAPVSAPAADSASGPAPMVPNLVDPRWRAAKPDLETIKRIRFLTTDDFPPFHFAGRDGSPTGFDVDLARAICRDLAIACTIQIRPFDSLIPQIKTGSDDALIAAVANTAATRADLAFTVPYYTTPARFVVRTTSAIGPMIPEALVGRVLGVEAGTAYEAYLRAFFPKAIVKTFAGRKALREALTGDAADAIFGDAIALALWLNGADSGGCCAFRGGPFTESRYFGNGVAIAVAKDNIVLRQALNFELAKLSQSGVITDLYLKYFPIGFY